MEIVKTIKHYLYDKRYTIEGVQKLFKEKGIKNLVGEEIQKDFFEAPATEIDANAHELLASLQQQLAAMKEELAEALKKSQN